MGLVIKSEGRIKLFLVSSSKTIIGDERYTGFAVRVKLSREMYLVGHRGFSNQIGRGNTVVLS